MKALINLVFDDFQTNIIVHTGIAGLAVTYALNLNSQLASITWNICNTENKMISVERIMQYSRIPSEAPLVVENYRPPNNWPGGGTINIGSLEVCENTSMS
jgi:hypothetical protein